jgi:hypothetical protein
VDALTLIAAALATARVTRLITTDVITEPLRVRIIRRLNTEGKLAYAIVCDWCSSIYVGAAVAGTWWAWGDTKIWLASVLALSFSYAAGFLNSKADD